MTALVLHCREGLSVVAQSGRYSPGGVHRLSAEASAVGEHRFNICSTRALLLRGLWDLPTPGIKPVYLTLAGRFFTVEPPGKPCFNFLNVSTLVFQGVFVPFHH